DDRIMTGGNIIAAQCCCFPPEIAELELFVAHHAWIRCSAGLVLAGEIINHQSLELICLVDHVMRNAQGMCNGTRVSHRLRTTAFVLGARDAILRPYFHGYADDLVALLAQQISCYAGVHPAAHPKKNTLFVSVHALRANQCRGSAHKSISCGRSVMPSACVSLPGPEQSRFTSSSFRRSFIRLIPALGSRARIKTKPSPFPFTSTFSIQCIP